MRYTIYNDDCLERLDKIEENSIDSIVTDPPYGLTSITKRFGKESSVPCQYGKDGSFARLSKGFMGKEWDGSGIEYNVELWKKCLKVLKPGGYLLAFGGSRTFHRIAVAIEDAGFEIRDTIMWIYGSGFPKSMNIGLALDKKNGIESEVIGMTYKASSPLPSNHKGTWTDNQKDGIYEIKKAQNEWAGWGTALKPSFEPIIVARKPFKGSLVDNVIKYGVGGINIDECRVGNKGAIGTGAGKDLEFTVNGRFPANTILTYDDIDYEEVCSGFPESKGASSQNNYSNGSIYRGQSLQKSSTILTGYREWYNDNGSASRYFYCAKASKKDRDEGLEYFDDNKITEISTKHNTHPTVKPTELMQYLVRLVTPKGGTILDPFMGSGSTGKAVMFENKERNADYKFIGIEKEKEYCDIAEARIKWANENKEDKENKNQITFDEIVQEEIWKIK